MRVGDSSQYRTITTDIFSLNYSQYVLQRQIATTHKVNTVSEGRSSSVTILNSRSVLRESDQYRVNLEAAASWMKASETGMDNMVDLLTRAKTLAEQTATGTYTDEQQASTAAELSNLIAELLGLGNSQVSGAYIFGGTRTDIPPLSAALTAVDPSTVYDQGSTGTGILTSAYLSGGVYSLQLARDTTGAANTITVPQDALTNTLGVGLGLDLDAWTQVQTASADQEDIWRSDVTFTSLNDLVSDRVGEVLNWVGDGGAGVQTYRTRGLVSFSGGAAGAAQVTVGADTYTVAGATAADSAADLVEQINSDPARGYYAYVENGTDVVVMSKDGTSYTLTETADPGAVMSVDADTTLSELTTAMNSGAKAMGSVHLDDANLPLGADTLTLGGDTYTWTQITNGVVPAPTTAAEYASALSNYLNSHRGDVTCSVSSSGAGATVQIQAKDAGMAGNLTLTSSNVNVGTSGSLMGGLNGVDSQGKLYFSGSSDLRLETTVRAEVTGVDPTSGQVSLSLSWYDDDGAYQTTTVDLAADGQDNAVAVPGLGDISIYRDDLSYKIGTVFELELSHYQGNDETLEVNFSNGNRMDYNYNAQDLLGGALTVVLDGETATAGRTNAGDGVVGLAGAYRGENSRDFTIDVLDGGQVPDDDVTLRVSWTDDFGEAHSEEVTLSAGGQTGRIALPDSEGVYLELDYGSFAEGDTYYYHLEQSPLHVLDSFYQLEYQLNNGTQEEGQEQSQICLESITAALTSILDQEAGLGIRQERVSLRETVLDEIELAHSSNLEDLQDVDMTAALIRLNAQQNAYQTSLKVISTINELFLAEML